MEQWDDMLVNLAANMIGKPPKKGNKLDTDKMRLYRNRSTNKDAETVSKRDPKAFLRAVDQLKRRQKDS